MGNHIFSGCTTLDGVRKTLRTTRKIYRLSSLPDQPFCSSCDYCNGNGVERQKEKFLCGTNGLQTRTDFGNYFISCHCFAKSNNTMDNFFCDHARIFSKRNKTFSRIRLLQDNCRRRSQFQFPKLCDTRCNWSFVHGNCNNSNYNDFYTDKKNEPLTSVW